MYLLGVAGPAGAGKDTVGDILEQEYGWKKFSFSDELYREVSEAWDLPEALFRNRELKETPLWCLSLAWCLDDAFVKQLLGEQNRGPEYRELLNRPRSPRWVLQRWGTDYRRGQNPRYWLDRAGEAVAVGMKHNKYPGMVNVSVRFPNELDWLDRNGGRLIHITRPGFEPESDFVSEKPLPRRTGDLVLRNDGDLDKLRWFTKQAIRKVTGG